MLKHKNSTGFDFARWFHNEYTAWLVWGLSAAITIFAWSVADEYADERAKENFEFEVEDARQSILYRMRNYEQALRGGVALFNASEAISRQEWKQYVESLQLEQTLPGIQGFGYAQVIRPEQLLEHEAAIRSEGFPAYRVRPRGDRDLYSSIVFLEPFDFRNRRAFGFDMYSEPTRKAAMDRAIITGDTAVSGIVKLKQETDTDIQAGFLMYLPVYQKNMPISTEEERKNAIKGFVYSPFRANDLMSGVLDNRANPLTFQLYDSNRIDPDLILYDSRAANLVEQDLELSVKPKYTSQSYLILPGRSWTVAFQSTPLFEQVTKSIQPQLILIAGGVIDVLLFLVISSLARQREILFRRNTEMEIIQGRYEGLVNGLKDQFAFFSMTPQGKLEYYSRSLFRFLGLRKLSDNKLFEESILDLEQAKQISQAIKEAIETRRIVGFSVLNKVNNSDRPLSLIGLISPTLDAKGDILSLEGVLQDDTERSFQEAELNDYRENLEKIVRDRTLRLEQANDTLKASDKRMQTLIGLSKLAAEVSKEQFIEEGVKVSRVLFASDGCFLLEVSPEGKPVQLYVVNNQLDLTETFGLEDFETGWFDYFKQLLDSGQSVVRLENIEKLLGPLQPRFDIIKHAMISISRESDSHAFILGVISQKTHYSDQSEHEINLFLEDFSRLIYKTEVAEELKKAKASAESASLAKRLFLANMSHEIRTPLNAIMGLNTLLLDEDVPESQRKMLEHMQTSSKHLLAILESILDFSRIDAGIVELESIEFDVKKSFYASGAALEQSALDKGLKMNLAVEPKIPDLVKGDPTRFNQIINNLLSNAIKFSAKGTVNVGLKIESLNDDYLTLALEVEDEGIGFDPARFKSLLQPFEQADNSHARRFGGTGLGLAIVNKLVDLMGGQLTVHSQPGVGSCFKATMKFKVANSSREMSGVDPVEEDFDYWLERFEGKHILVVDDNLLNRKVVEALLTRVGIRTSVAEDGVCALQVLRQNSSIDLVLMDLHMPNLDGIGAVEQIRIDSAEALRKIKIIALTACATNEDRDRALAVGMDDYMVKPIDSKILYDKLNKHLNQTA